ncbi:hypothetical protein [Tautonia plasticadhaerens]|uniref:Nickel uptake substrate-specific transmembrane region n=1 Tax=Tautonia plasticadhaerens TaxID=2527974 RepID=A0A518GV03_9BACT|nr:hypothetical protein [Tautonia plasticadhaerens]QDV32415.1 hypothetical protein ElP_02470 [Tautonia plasticadhaerens]
MRTPRQTIPPRAAAALLLALSVAGPGCDSGPDDGLEKHPVRGSVLVNGEPAELMVVTFHNLDPAAPGNAGRPVGATDAEGRFELSTNADRDGAVAGEYAVTFFWSSSNTINAADRLGGRFTEPSRSEFKVRVVPGDNDLEPFRLEVEPSQIRPADGAAPVVFQ